MAQRRSEESGSTTSCEGHDHGHHSNSRDWTHHWAHDARRRNVRLQGTHYTTRETMIDLGPRQATGKAEYDRGLS